MYRKKERKRVCNAGRHSSAAYSHNPTRRPAGERFPSTGSQEPGRASSLPGRASRCTAPAPPGSRARGLHGGTSGRTGEPRGTHTHPPATRSIFKERGLRAARRRIRSPRTEAARPLTDPPGLPPRAAPRGPAESRVPRPRLFGLRSARNANRVPSPQQKTPGHLWLSQAFPSKGERGGPLSLNEAFPRPRPSPQLGRRPPRLAPRGCPPARPAPSPVRRSLTGPFLRPPGLDMSPAAGAAGLRPRRGARAGGQRAGATARRGGVTTAAGAGARAAGAAAATAGGSRMCRASSP